jgi:Ca2+/Na+ antiporter
LKGKKIHPFTHISFRLVPALNVISDYYNIPDDIAGATLMAAGASSPELFSSLVSLFITKSSLGLGTVGGYGDLQDCILARVGLIHFVFNW